MTRREILSLANDPFREFTRRRLVELAGVAILAFSGALTLALFSWSARDPSLNHATDARVHNYLGLPGAVVADLLMQLLGVGGVVAAMLPLAALGLRLLAHRAGNRASLRILLWLGGVLCAAAAASLFPVTDRWPLPTGLGGIIGDALLALPRALFGGNRLVLAGVGVAAMLGAIIMLTGAAGYGFESEDDLRDAQRRLAQADRPLARVNPEEEGEDDAGEPGYAIIALGALLHAALTSKALAKRGFAVLFRRGRAAPAPRQAALSGVARREPVFEDHDASAAPAAPRPSRLAPQAEPAPRAQVGSPVPAKRAPRERAPAPGNSAYEYPELELLAEPKKPAGQKISQEVLEQNARALEGVLDDFSVRGEIINMRPGPVVTLYELEPAPGIKSSRVIGLADDIARSMSAISARVAVVPGRNAIGIELPNQRRETVYLRELLACEDFIATKHRLAIALGKTIGGDPVIVDLARMPHLLVAGTTGSGKSVAINTMILSLLYRLKPDECRLIMVDPKMLELSVYDNIPHLLTPVVTDPKKAVVALKWAVREMEDRYRKMSKVGVRNIDGFNARVLEARAKGEVITRTVQTGFDAETGEAIFESEEMDLAPLPFIVVVVDEMADLMLVAGKDIEGAIQRLAQMARAAGIHLIMATQRPSVDVITGTIKANFPTRISFQVTSKIDSRTILGEQGAEQLLGQGDMLYMAGGGRISRVHGPFVSDAEVEKVVAHLKAQGQPQYLDAITSEDDGEGGEEDAPLASSGSMDEEEAGSLYDRAVAIVLRDRKVSTSYIQRRLSVGYNKAASLVEQMEKQGVVSPPNHSGKREILVGGGVDRGAFDVEAAE
ncbi:MAG TPA: DNA translocase FtsK 4TM domain-containing protein [Methylocystis sp.]|nr:DNA translocase FtsK 4TM domain-containing protein [Methylocystis sp.]